MDQDFLGTRHGGEKKSPGVARSFFGLAITHKSWCDRFTDIWKRTLGVVGTLTRLKIRVCRGGHTPWSMHRSLNIDRRPLTLGIDHCPLPLARVGRPAHTQKLRHDMFAPHAKLSLQFTLSDEATAPHLRRI